jgi:ankyrin repeat protein
MQVNDVAVMRRRSDSWLNATQILKVAGVEKGKRTKVLEREILTGEHEKVQGGYGKYQGTWINYNRGREFCRQYGVEDILRPLLDYDVGSDGSGQPGHLDTPTKEQAMAANRKRMYTQSQEGRQGQVPAGGTFFSNLSSTASNAISAMNKAARLSTPQPRPPNLARKPSGNPPRSLPNSQESFPPNSQRSMQGMPPERSFNAINDSAYLPQPVADHAPMDSQEPPRKRLRSENGDVSFSQSNGDVDVMMRDGSPTEPNDSFYYRPPAQMMPDGDVHIALPPLPHPADKRAEEKQSLLLDLFADLYRTDYSSHPAILHLSGADLDLPLDQSANTALHWAATLARIPLMRLLISKGASIFRGNIAGETPLMAAVQVNNCLDHTCFPDLLEILSPLIEICDVKGRTILHHIAVASGIKGRANSSKYYLEALLEFLVRQTSSGVASGSSFDAINGTAKPLGLMRFMSEMVNARDVSGNTALNLVARIGNRSIIRQLIEVQADPTIPNHKGLSPMDFGVEATDPDSSKGAVIPESPGRKTPSKTEEASRELVPSKYSMLAKDSFNVSGISASISDMQSQFSAEIRLMQDRVDSMTANIQEVSSQQKALSVQVETQQAQVRERQDRKRRLQNLRRAVSDMRERILGKSGHMNGEAGVTLPLLSIGDADADFANASPALISAALPVYKGLNASLAAHLTSLKARDTELEAKYRKVVALCTGVDENKVDSVLPQLVQAVESEPENDVGRVREFLKRVEAVAGP